MTSPDGHVDGVRKSIDNNSSITRQNQPKTFRQKVHGLVQLLITFSCQGYTVGRKPFMMKIMIIAIFISVNTIHKLLLHEFIPVNHGYDQRLSKVDLRLPRL